MAGSRQIGIAVPRIEDTSRPIDRAVQYLLRGGTEKITCLITGSFSLRDITQCDQYNFAREMGENLEIPLVASTLPPAVSMTNCKKRSMMLPEIERIRGKQLGGALEAQRLAWPGV